MKKIFKAILNIDPIYLYLIGYILFLVARSIFRDATGDESIYLRETTIMSELIGKGVWFGDYAVGLHGFLFKIPVALIFVALGHPSVYIATLYTILLSGATLLLFYKLLRKYFFDKKYALLTVILLSGVFHFLDMSLSFSRDIPALFCVLLFLYLFFNKSNKWLIGLSLLLLLDAKEHIFLTVAPFYFVYLLVEFIKSIKKEKLLSQIKDFFMKCFSGYFFSIVWIVLMFTTSIIPINMFVASISGLIEDGLSWNVSQFSYEVGGRNLLEEGAKEIPPISEASFGCNVQSNK